MNAAQVRTATPAETREQLRRLIRAIETRPGAPRSALRQDSGGAASGRHDLGRLGLTPRETPAGLCMVREVRSPLLLDASSGPEAFDFSDLTQAEPGSLALLAPETGSDGATLDELLFLDIETTGLGGAGAMAFLVATGRVEGTEFVLRQYLAPSPPDEAGLLHALIADGGVREADPVLVTYNGRAFDAPILDSRATMHRQRAGFEALRHIDLLLPVRTAYRGLLPSCRLGVVEHAVLGMTRPGSEVSGAETPAWYFRYLRTQDSRVLAPLLDHNARDVLALAALTGWFAAAVGGRHVLEGRHALAAGRLLAARGRRDDARRFLGRVATDPQPSLYREEALVRLAMLHKSEGRRDLAEPLWLSAAAQRGSAALRPLRELAVYYEQHVRDYTRALAVVRRGMDIVEGIARSEPVRAQRAREQWTRRRLRLQAKVDRERSRPPCT